MNKTPLHLAAENGHKSIVQLLFRAITEISPDNLNEIVNPTGGTIPPIHLAINGNHLSVVEILLKQNAEISLKHPTTHLTPLDSAISQNHK